MAHLHHRSSAVLPRRHRVALAVALACLGNASVALADNATLPAVTVSGATAAPVADVSGFGDQPLATSPFSATVIDSNAIADTGARRLKLSYGIVKNHNGRIELESTPGVGTLFRVVLPVHHVETRSEA